MELEIADGERAGANGRYPMTVGFCKLICKLMETTDIPHNLGRDARGQRPPGIQPYLEFIREMIFVRWTRREYYYHLQKWNIALSCIQIFHILIVKYDESSVMGNNNIQYMFNKHPSFEMYAMLLTSHSPMIDVIMDVFQQSFDIVFSDKPYFDGLTTVQLCLRYVLRFICVCIENENSFLNVCKKYWAQKLNVRSLVLSLLNNIQYRLHIKNISHCVNYDRDVYIAMYAVKIFNYLSIAKQGITIRNMFENVCIFVCFLYVFLCYDE